MHTDFLDHIVLGDSLELLQRVPDSSVDVVFADPPFNLGKAYKSTRDNLPPQEYLTWCERWISEVVRVTKDTGSIFLHNIPKWLTYFSGILNRQQVVFKHWIAWDAPTAPMGKSLQPAHYGILFYVKDPSQAKFYEVRRPHPRCRKCHYLIKDYGGKKSQLHPFGPLLSDVWTDIHRVKHRKHRDKHPCQLPIHLLERVLLMSTDEGDIVLDPFSGTGTTAVAAKRLGRHYVGLEIDPDYVQISREKLRSETASSKIGGAWVSFYSGDVVTIRDSDWPELAPFFAVPEPAQTIERIAARYNGNLPLKLTW